MELYKINFPNGKIYIGITRKTAEYRLKRHYKVPEKDRQPCQRALHKYGLESIRIEKLATCDEWELLCLSEREAIEKYDTLYPNGYNMTLGGEGTLKTNLTGEAWEKRERERISVYSKARRESDPDAAKERDRVSREKYKEKNKAKRLQDSDKIKEKAKLYRLKNKEKTIEYSVKTKDTRAICKAEYYSKNKEKLKQKSSKYYEENKEKCIERMKNRLLLHRDKINAARRVRRKQLKEQKNAF